MAAPADMPAFRGNVTAVRTARFWDDKIGEIQHIKTILKAPEKRYRRWAAYSELDPDGKYADRRAEFLKWYKPMMAQEPDRKKDRRAHRAWERKMKADIDAHAYTPEELNYLKANHSNGGFHYMGSGKIYSRIGEAFARAILDMSGHARMYYQ